MHFCLPCWCLGRLQPSAHLVSLSHVKLVRANTFLVCKYALSPTHAPCFPPGHPPACSALQVTVLAKIGEGAFGEVSLAQCSTYGRVAIKWIKPTKVRRLI